MVLERDWRGHPELDKGLIVWPFLLVSSHVGRLNSKEVSLGCLSDIGLGLWGLHLGDVEFD